MVDFLCWASILKHESIYTESVQQEEKWSSRKRRKKRAGKGHCNKRGGGKPQCSMTDRLSFSLSVWASCPLSMYIYYIWGHVASWRAVWQAKEGSFQLFIFQVSRDVIKVSRATSCYSSLFFPWKRWFVLLPINGIWLYWLKGIFPKTGNKGEGSQLEQVIHHTRIYGLEGESRVQ